MKRGGSFLNIVPVELRRKWSQYLPLPTTTVICFNLGTGETNVREGNVCLKQMLGSHRTVCSMINGAYQLTSFIAVFSARVASAPAWMIIPLRMEIIFNDKCDVFDLIILWREERWRQGDRETRREVTTLPNHLHCALLMRSKACLLTIYESFTNKVTFHSTFVFECSLHFC